MAAEGFWVIESVDRQDLRVRKPPRRPTHLFIVVPRTHGVHAERTTRRARPRFPQAGPRASSELRNELGPDRNHPYEQRYRRQSR